MPEGPAAPEEDVPVARRVPADLPVEDLAVVEGLPAVDVPRWAAEPGELAPGVAEASLTVPEPVALRPFPLAIAANAGPAVLPNTTTPAVNAARPAFIDRRVTRGRRLGLGFNLDCAAIPYSVSERPRPKPNATNEREHVSQSSHHAK
ncbi:hypothetical protein ABT369_33760 [Dactylosporangium sp. NPDC000244]|uniref:hypothetical protein n=1 Tax=Dactylosporangium sp. NPDC000244 TaxID=3154365 RepID=UPI00331AA68D